MQCLPVEFFLKRFSFLCSFRLCVKALWLRDQTGLACVVLEDLRDCLDQKVTEATQLLVRRARREDEDILGAMEASEIQKVVL